MLSLVAQKTTHGAGLHKSLPNLTAQFDPSQERKTNETSTFSKRIGAGDVSLRTPRAADLQR